MEQQNRALRLVYILLFFGILTVCGLYTVHSKVAYCAWCPSYDCYNGCFSKGCVCVTAPGEYKGKCYGVSYASEFKRRGYEVR